MADVGAGDVGRAEEVRRRPVEQVAQARQGWQHGQLHALDLQVFVERQRGEPDRVPAADAGLLVGRHQRHRRTGEGDAPVLAEVHLVLDPGRPVADELRFIEQQVLRPVGARLAFAPGVDDRVDASQLQHRVVEGGVQDVGRRHAGAQQGVGHLQHQRGLADLPGAGEHHRTGSWGRGHPRMELDERRPPPSGNVSQRLASPPGIELGEDGGYLFLRDLHAEFLNY